MDVERLDAVIERHLRLDLGGQRPVGQRVLGAIRSNGDLFANLGAGLARLTCID